jgi:hypothetical protein
VPDAAPGPAAKRFPWDTRPLKCNSIPPDLARVYGCVEMDWPDYATASEHVGMLFVQSQTDLDLVLRAERELNGDDREFPNGEYRFEAWYNGTLGALGQAPFVYSYAPLVERWKAQGLDSYAAIADAMLSRQKAWQARGGGFSNSVSPEAWEIYYRKLDEADAVLDAASPRVRASGPWAALKLTLVYERKTTPAQRAAVLDAVTTTWPHYRRLYQVAMAYSRPRWGGDYVEVERIARVAMDKNQPGGVALYADLYGSFLTGNWSESIKDTKADWDLIKQGIREGERRAPHNAGQLSALSKVACQQRDRDEARRLLTLFDALPPGARAPYRSASPDTDSCRAFAFGAKTL